VEGSIAYKHHAHHHDSYDKSSYGHGDGHDSQHYRCPPGAECMPCPKGTWSKGGSTISTTCKPCAGNTTTSAVGGKRPKACDCEVHWHRHTTVSNDCGCQCCFRAMLALVVQHLPCGLLMFEAKQSSTTYALLVTFATAESFNNNDYTSKRVLNSHCQTIWVSA
jgi:hypothetical protein